MIVSAFVGYIVTQSQVVNFRYEQQRATDIAEAGLNYYKWFLSHYPGDVTNGTGAPGPYVHQYKDPEGGFIGEFSLEVASSTYCGDITAIDITSTGYTYAEPEAKAIVRARYVRPTVAEYSFITNSGVWYGAGGSVVGPVHSNQGIRMDSAHNSTVGSGQLSWTCNSSYGCSPTQVVDGVYTTSGDADPGLFSFPVSPIDFAGISLDLSGIKDKAQNHGGRYYGPSGGHGYSVVFNGNNTATVYRVTNTTDYQSYSSSQGWHWGERNVISNQVSLGNVTISNSCPVLFFEDKVWVSGNVNQKVMLAAANLSLVSQTNVVLNGDLRYVAGSGAGIVVIAEDDIDIGVTVPNNMDINGIFIAQNGRFGRNHYTTGYFSSALDPYVIRNSLDTLGTVVSNQRAGTTWVNASGVTISGFQGGVDSYDQDQVENPPPFTPETSDVYSFRDWRQDG